MDAASFRMPQQDLRRVAEANAVVVDVAKDLLELAKTTVDPALAKRLQADIEKLLDNSDVISSAVRKASPVRG